jgi:hypothetical protein
MRPAPWSTAASGGRIGTKFTRRRVDGLLSGRPHVWSPGLRPGTDLYRVHDDLESSDAQSYYPEEAGSRCERVTRVPYRPNSVLVLLNGRGAHGASIPSDAPRDRSALRISLYVGSDADEFAAPVAKLPDARQSAWRDKSEAGPAAG